MKKQLIICVTLALLAGTCYGCSSPPAQANSLKQKEPKVFTPTVPTAPVYVVAMPEYEDCVVSIPSSAKTSYLHTNAVVLYKTVSRPATSGSAIDRRVDAGLTIISTLITTSTGHSHTHLHIDPGLTVNC